MPTDSRPGKSNALSNEILINACAGETRVAILEQGDFNEIYIERERERSVAGTVTLGRVSRVLPGMQAAFVDIGLEKAACIPGSTRVTRPSATVPATLRSSWRSM